MKKPKQLNTTFANYKVEKVIGQGGNGYVYKASSGKEQVAIKVLDPNRATVEKLKRFQNEYRFCAIDRHPNIIRVFDHGLSDEGAPFFTMPLYTSSIRNMIGKLNEDECFSIITQIIDGVEASHKLSVVHRDLKPENILYSDNDGSVVLADFGIAEFSEEELFTAVDTKDGTRLANFQYAAPEQRDRNGIVDHRTDIWSLGLIINELFTGKLALGKNHKSISDVSEKYSYFDAMVDQMMQQEKDNRYQDVEAIKLEISVRSKEYISTLKLNKLNNTVIPSHEINDPIVADPMRIVDVEWDDSALTIHLNHQPNQQWIRALNNMGNYSSVYAKGPEMFQFRGSIAVIPAAEHEAQSMIDHFKAWMPKVALAYHQRLKADADSLERQKIEAVEREIAAEEKKQVINSSLSF